MAWHTTLNMNVFPFFDISGFLYLTILDFLICKWRIFAQDTWIPNACPLRRGQINVNSNVSYKQTKQVDKETCKSQRAQNYLQHQEWPPTTTINVKRDICLAPQSTFHCINQKKDLTGFGLKYNVVQISGSPTKSTLWGYSSWSKVELIVE